MSSRKAPVNNVLENRKFKRIAHYANISGQFGTVVLAVKARIEEVDRKQHVTNAPNRLIVEVEPLVVPGYLMS